MGFTGVIGDSVELSIFIAVISSFCIRVVFTSWISCTPNNLDLVIRSLKKVARVFIALTGAGSSLLECNSLFHFYCIDHPPLSHHFRLYFIVGIIVNRGREKDTRNIRSKIKIIGSRKRNIRSESKNIRSWSIFVFGDGITTKSIRNRKFVVARRNISSWFIISGKIVNGGNCVGTGVGGSYWGCGIVSGENRWDIIWSSVILKSGDGSWRNVGKIWMRINVCDEIVSVICLGRDGISNIVQVGIILLNHVIHFL